MNHCNVCELGSLVGFVQEHRSEKSLEALNKLVPHHCHVIRYIHSTADLLTSKLGAQ